ncbi:MAG: molybdate ABC transporter substrate-binding protein [Pseudomonadota bacterium]
MTVSSLNLNNNKIKALCILIVSCFSLLACDSSNPQKNQIELLIYCGITMSNPMREIANNFEKKHQLKITITQGGSEDLYQSLKAAKKGDLYLPGSASYRDKHFADGLLKESVKLGYNQAALLVKKGNPKNISADINNLTRKDLNVVIGSHESGSIGKETKKILEKLGIYNVVLNNVLYLTSDSRTLNHALKKGDADVIINWKATAFFDNNKLYVDAISLDPKIAKPKQLLLNALSFSKHPQLVAKFMQYASSAEANSIFKKFGFLTPQSISVK